MRADPPPSLFALSSCCCPYSEACVNLHASDGRTVGRGREVEGESDRLITWLNYDVQFVLLTMLKRFPSSVPIVAQLKLIYLKVQFRLRCCGTFVLFLMKETQRRATSKTSTSKQRTCD